MLTQKRLKELLDYNPESGKFVWKVSHSNVKDGNTAGGLNNNGYHLICVDGKKSYAAHRLAWLYMYGHWPRADIDHINGDRSDNRIQNLREATDSENLANSRLYKSNTTGYRGVSWNRRRGIFVAFVRTNQKLIYLGSFKSAARAGAVAKLARIEYFGQFAN